MNLIVIVTNVGFPSYQKDVDLLALVFGSLRLSYLAILQLRIALRNLIPRMRGNIMSRHFQSRSYTKTVRDAAFPKDTKKFNFAEFRNRNHSMIQRN